jgi:hypothetical protein
MISQKILKNNYTNILELCQVATVIFYIKSEDYILTYVIT